MCLVYEELEVGVLVEIVVEKTDLYILLDVVELVAGNCVERVA